MIEDAKVPSWEEIESDARYLNADETTQNEMKEKYYREYVEPKATEQGLDVENVKQEFYKRVNVPQPQETTQFVNKDEHPELDDGDNYLDDVLFTQEELDSFKDNPITFFEAGKYFTKEDIPLYGTYETGKYAYKAYKVIDKMKEGTPFDELPEEDRQLVIDTLRHEREMALRGFSLGGNIAYGTGKSLSFAADLGLTGGATGFGKATLKQAIKQGVKKSVKEMAKLTTEAGVKGVAKKEAIKATASAAKVQAIGKFTAVQLGKTIPMASVVLPTGYKTFGDRQLAQGITATDKGEIILNESVESPLKSALMAYTGTAAEVASEMTGGAIAGAIGKVASPITKSATKYMPETVKRALYAGRKALKPSERVSKLFSRAGWNGFIGEYGEEEFSNILQAGISYVGGDYTKEEALEALKGNVNDRLVTLGVIGTMSGISTATSLATNAYMKRKMTKKEAQQVADSTGEIEKEKLALQENPDPIDYDKKMTSLASEDYDNVIDPLIVDDEELKTTDEVTDVHGDEYYKKMTLSSGGEQVGSIDYSVVDGKPYIQMIDVPENQRRKGYATELVKRLQQEFPDQEIDFGMLTDEGAKLYESLPKRVDVNPEYDEMQKKYDESNKKLQEYENIINESTGEETGEAKERFLNAGKSWDEEQRRNEEYREWLNNNKREKVYIETRPQGQIPNITRTRPIVEFNAVTFEDPENQEAVRKAFEANGFSRKAADVAIANLQRVVDFVKKLAERSERLKEQNERNIYVEQRPTEDISKYEPEEMSLAVDSGKKTLGMVPRVSVFVKNGEYQYNIDFGTTCTRREPLEAAVQIMIDMGKAGNLGMSQINNIKDILGKHGFTRPCTLCFVEGKRTYELISASRLSRQWNTVLKSIGVEDGKVIGTKRKLSKEMVTRLKELQSGEGYEKYVDKQYRDRSDKDPVGLTRSRAKAIAKIMLDEYERKGTSTLVNRMRPDMLMNSRGTDYLFRKYITDAPTLKGLIAARDGAGTPKPHTSYPVYDTKSWKEIFDLKKDVRAEVKHLFDIGGVRLQSFSDFNEYMVIDYLQAMMDMAARGLPAHAYTKVPSFVELFGTMMNINMSLIGDTARDVPVEYDGLRPAKEGDRVVLEDENGKWTYNWARESFDPAKAFELRKAVRFKGKVGTIGVGISDKMIEAMLKDPEIDMVIPFHKSGIQDHILISAGMKRADGTTVKDYSLYQNTKGLKKGAEDYMFNQKMQEIGDAKKVAKDYLKWCKEHKYTPKFEQFSTHENYYKLLEDFRSYDNEGKPVIQKAVNFEISDDFNDILAEAIENRDNVVEAISKIKDDDALMADLNEAVRYTHLDGELRKIMLKKIEKALGGKDNVKILSQDDFLDELGKTHPEEAQQFRNGDGVLYGFAKDGKIYLNVQGFNAHTPVHEYSHVWSRVVQKTNPTLWNKGVSLLKQTEKWKELKGNKHYANLDDDSFASEVLAHIMGERNEEIAKYFQDPYAPEYKGASLKNKILKFIKDMFGHIRSMFDPKFDVNDKDAVKKLAGEVKSAEDFATMSLLDLYDDGRASAFAKRLQEMRKAGEFGTYSDSDNVDFQYGYHGTASDRLEGGQFKLERVGSGTGGTAHGWGAVYVAQKREVAEKYRKNLVTPKQSVVVFGDVSFDKNTGKYENSFDARTPEYLVYSRYKQLGKDFDALIKYYESRASQDAYWQEMIDIAYKYKDKLDDAREIHDESLATGNVYKVDIPDNPYLINEGKSLAGQPKFVKAQLEKMNEDSKAKGFLTSLRTYNKDSKIDGRDVYRKIAEYAGSEKDASFLLKEYGIKGITYDSFQDDVAFVIFDPSDVQVVQNFYGEPNQTENISFHAEDVKSEIKAMDEEMEMKTSVDAEIANATIERNNNDDASNIEPTQSNAKTLIARGVDSFIYQYVNQKHRLESLGKNIKGDIRNFYGIVGTIKAYLTAGFYEDDGNGNIVKTGKSFKNILDDFDNTVMDVEPSKNQRLSDFSDYLIAQRYLEDLSDREDVMVTEEQKEKSIADLLKLQQKYGDKFVWFEEFSNELYDYQKKILHKLVDSGNMTEEQFEEMTSQNKHYVPFNRVVDDDGNFIPPKGKFTKAKSPVKKIRGSEREIKNVFQNIVTNISKVISVSERNKIAKEIADALVEVGEAEKVPPIIQKKGTAEIKVDGEVYQKDVWGTSPFEPKGTMTVYENGKRTFYKVHNADVLKELEDVDHHVLDYVVKLIKLPSTLLRRGATEWNPDFVFRNPLRDIQIAFAQSTLYKARDAYKIPGQWMKAMFDVIRGTDLYNERIAAGGGFETFMGQDEKGVNKNFLKVYKDIFGENSRILQKMNPFGWVSKAGEIAEQTTRQMIFNEAKRQGYSSKEASFISRDTTLDFAVAGKTGKMYNQVIPFLNAGIRASATMFAKIAENPKLFLTKALITQTIPSILMTGYYLYGADDDDRKEFLELPQWRRHIFWNFKIGDTWWAFPKAFALSEMFATPVELAMIGNYEGEDKPEAKNMFMDTLSGIYGSLSPIGDVGSIMPVALKLAVEQAANYNFFTGRRIYPEYMDDYVPYMRTSKSTPEIYNVIGKKLNISPARLEHISRSLLGGTSRYITDAGDTLVAEFRAWNGEKTPSKPFSWSNVPVIRGFVTHTPAGYNSQSVQNFYDALKEGKQIHASYNKLKGEEKKEFAKKHQTELRNYNRLKSFEKSMKSLRGVSDAIMANKNLGSFEKADKIDAVEKRMTDLARKANNMLKKTKR